MPDLTARTSCPTSLSISSVIRRGGLPIIDEENTPSRHPFLDGSVALYLGVLTVGDGELHDR